MAWNKNAGIEHKDGSEQTMEQKQQRRSEEQMAGTDVSEQKAGTEYKDGLEQTMEQGQGRSEEEQHSGTKYGRQVMEQDMEITSEEEKIRQLSDLLKEKSTNKSILTDFVRQNDFSFDNIVTSTPKSDLKRDIPEVWIPADKVKLFNNLNINEKRILTSKQWINDIIIDSAMNLLAYQFPDLEGFQSCQLAHQLDLFVLRFYGPVNPMGSCRARSVYLTTRLLGRLSPLSC